MIGAAGLYTKQVFSQYVGPRFPRNREQGRVEAYGALTRQAVGLCRFLALLHCTFNCSHALEAISHEHGTLSLAKKAGHKHGSLFAATGAFRVVLAGYDRGREPGVVPTPSARPC